MIEVLVAILVLAVGVIGATGMQLAAARTAKQSSLQTTAMQLAAEMGDKIRANDPQAANTTASPLLDVDYNSEVQGEPLAPKRSCFKTNCTEAEFAEFALYVWLKRIKADLPGGRARICRDARPWDPTTRSLSWTCSAGGNGEAATRVVKVGWQGKNPDGSPATSSGNEVPPAVALAVKPYGD